MLDYVRYPSWVLKETCGNPHALSILSTLSAYQITEKRQSYYMTISKISRLSGVSRSQVYRGIDFLTKKGLIREFNNRRGEYSFDLLFYREKEEIVEKEEVQLEASVNALPFLKKKGKETS